MRSFFNALLALTAAAGLAAAWLFWPGRPVEVTIPFGQSARHTAAMLKGKGVVRSAVIFRVLARVSGVGRHLKPGVYRLSERMAPWRLLAALNEGGSGIRVVVPEGWAAWQIAEALEHGGVCRGGDFSRYVAEHQLEGYLFPDTYYFEPGAEAARVAERMHAEFTRRVAEEFARADPRPQMTLHQVLTLASIVEREAVLRKEQAMVAAVYLNRMRIRMRLQADPTVQYALGGWKKGLTAEDLRDPSPYNTYTHYGLPPGPICNPGLDAVRAAMHPAPIDSIYFVADAAGGHVFTSSQEDHIRAKQTYKRAVREEKKRLREQGRES